MDEEAAARQESSKSSEASSEAFESPSKTLCLSAALENLPLVYLPQTKQLVTAPWPRNIGRRHSANSPPHARASCSELPEFSFEDDCTNAKRLAGSKISEDSGYPGLWDSDASLSREVQSERNSSVCSSDLLECDLEAYDGNAREETRSPDDVALDNLRLTEIPDVGDSSSSCTGKESTDSCASDSCNKDLESSFVSGDSAEEAKPSSVFSTPVILNDSVVNDSTLVNQSPKVEKPKRGSFASFFTSALFGGRGKSQPESPTAAAAAANATAENQIEQTQENASRNPSSSLLFKKSDMEKSTTALILQERPKGLPSKDPEEEARHRHQYQLMVEEAKQKERKDAKRQKQKMKQQLKQEAMTTSALKIWTNEILPNWENAKNSKRARDLWWSGIPPRIRGRVWQLAIGNELNITAELYEICLVRAKERLRIVKDTGSDSDSLSSFTAESTMSRESSLELIRLDVSRTFPNLCIFQKGGPYHDPLQGLLGSYACYRPDVGYVQGMSFIAAMLLLNMEVADAFICFANLLNKPCLLAFFRLDRSLMDAYFDTFGEFFHENLPQLHQHLCERSITPDLYLLDWLFTLYAKSLSLDVVSRVWDVYFRDGEEFLFRTALGLLRMYEDVLLNLEFDQLALFLTRLPSDICCDDLFRCIATVSMEIDRQQFAHVLVQHREALVT